MKRAKIKTVGDSSILIEMTQEISPEINGKITSLMRMIKAQKVEGIVDMIPSFCALLINYDPRVLSYKEITKRITKLMNLEMRVIQSEKTIYEIPVCYGGEFGKDLPFIAANAGISEEEVIRIHSGRDYLIYMLGFMPGFPYLGGLDEKIHTPRLENPRLKIQAGSVGIGGAQTGIYPMDSPGGWQLLGQTPVPTYNPQTEQILFEAGNYIRFKPITAKEYEEIRLAVAEGSYKAVIIKDEV